MSPKHRPEVDLSELESLDNEKGFLPGTSLDSRRQSRPVDDDSGFVVGEYRLTDIEPDIYQSRGGVLPREILSRVLSGEITHPQALDLWASSLVDGTPQYDRYQALVDLKNSILANSLLHPIHIYRDIDRSVYVIQAGERRYWAFWMLQIEKGTDRIPAVVHANPSRSLQITENEEVSPLSTIGRARQAALAYLELVGLPPSAQMPMSDDQYWDYYRQSLLGAALIGKKNLPNSFWPDMQSRFGMARQTVMGLLELLNLTDSALTIADEWHLTQSQILAILGVSKEIQDSLALLVVNHGLLAPEIKRIAKLAQGSDGGDAYWAAVDELEGTAVKSPRGSTLQRQKNRNPLEVHTSRIVTAYKGIEKISAGDYQNFARYITLTRSDDALRLAEQFEQTAQAIRRELGQD